MIDTKGLTHITYVCNKYYTTQVTYTTIAGFCYYFNTHSIHITMYNATVSGACFSLQSDKCVLNLKRYQMTG